MFVTYEPGGRSSSSGKLMRHTGTEFAYLLRGKLKIQVGFDEYVLQAGDALAFDSSEPHLLVNEGSEPAEGIWFVLGRRLARVARRPGHLPGERPVRTLHRGEPAPCSPAIPASGAGDQPPARPAPIRPSRDRAVT